MYGKLAGMSGTAVTEAEEFDKIYKLEVLAIPTNLEYQANSPRESGLVELEGRDDNGYKYRFYARSDDTAKDAGIIGAKRLPGCNFPDRGSQVPLYCPVKSCAIMPWVARC
jgi:hypothetical protein